jgi:hypothetical protein
LLLSKADPDQIIIVFPFSQVYEGVNSNLDFIDGAMELSAARSTTEYVGVSRRPFFRHPQGLYEKNSSASLFHDAVWLPDRERFCFMPEEPVPIDQGLAKLAQWDPERFSNEAPHSPKAFVYFGITPRQNRPEHIGTNPEVNAGRIFSSICQIVRTGKVEEDSEPDLYADADDETSEDITGEMDADEDDI